MSTELQKAQASDGLPGLFTFSYKDLGVTYCSHAILLQPGEDHWRPAKAGCGHH